MNLTWVLVVLFLGDPAPRPPLLMPLPDKGVCQAAQGVMDKLTKEGNSQMPPHVSWCVQWPKDVPPPVVKP